MKAFEFTKKDNKEICENFNKQFQAELDEVMALATITRHWFKKDKVFVFKTYEREFKKIYVYYKDRLTNHILEFESENEAYNFILM